MKKINWRINSAVQFCVLAMVFLLGGCATTNTQFAIAPNVGTQIPAGQGALLMLVTNNSTSVNYNTLKLVPAGSGDPSFHYVVNAESIPGSGEVQYFSGVLPPGKYRVTEFSLSTGNARYWVTLNEKTNYEFIIETGKVSDLGRMIQSEFTDNRSLIFRAENEPSVLPLLRVAKPELYQALTQSNVEIIPGWSALPEKQEALWLWLSKLITRDFNNPTKTDSGKVVGGTRLGSALIRADDGRWKVLDFNSNQPIQVVADLADNGLFAGGELNRLFLQKPSGEIAPFSSEGLPFGKLVLARYYPNTGLVLAIQTPQRLSIYGAKSIEAPHWELLQSVEQQNNFFLDKTKIVTTEADGQLYVGQGDELLVFNVGTRQWRMLPLPFDIEELIVEGNRWVALGSKLLSSNTYISTDGGKNWNKTITRSSDSIIHFVSDAEGYVLSDDEGGMIKSTTDAGKTWFVYDKPKSDVALDFNLTRNYPVVMLDNKEMLIIVPNLQGRPGSAIYRYNIVDKKLMLERYVTIPILLNYLRTRYENNTPPAETK